MKKLVVVGILGVLTACQTVKVKLQEYKTTEAITEIGSVGEAKSLFKLKNDFKTKAFPKLESKIRVAIEIVPFTKKLNEIYAVKAKYSQGQSKITYSDSLPVKPEIVTVNIMDVAGFVSQLNAEDNKEVYRFIYDTKKSKLISGISVVLPQEDITKIKQADTYYLSNNQDEKYIVQLYKQGKKTEKIDITQGTVVAYKLSNFCWNVTERGKWYIADIVEECSSCKGNTKAFVSKKKKEKSLFEM